MGKCRSIYVPQTLAKSGWILPLELRESTGLGFIWIKILNFIFLIFPFILNESFERIPPDTTKGFPGNSMVVVLKINFEEQFFQNLLRYWKW